MQVQYFKEYSHFLNKEMEFKVFGHTGKPCIAFPSQNGRFFDYENNGIIESMRYYIDSGMIQVFCVDTFDYESFCSNKSARDKILAQEAYYNYIANELIPRISKINKEIYNGVLAYGVSMGAYHALNFFVRRPDIFNSVLSLSGIYKTSYFLGDYHDDLTYLNSPIDSIRGLGNNTYYLDLYRKASICICVGQGAYEDECIRDTREIDGLFREKGIPAWVDYWGYDIIHDWCSWIKQTPYFLHHILN